MGTSLFALPEIRSQVFLNYAMDNQNIRWTTQYIDSYEDQRDEIFTHHPEGRTIDRYVTHDLSYRLDLGVNTTVLATVDNVFDEEPPFARTEINYDSLTHNPLGRTFKLGLRMEF